MKVREIRRKRLFYLLVPDITQLLSINFTRNFPLRLSLKKGLDSGNVI